MTTDVQRDRIREARHQATRNRLIGEGLLPGQADAWIDSWIRVGGDASKAAFWELGYEWIRRKVNAGEKP